MKKITELYTLNERETVLLNALECLSDNEQINIISEFLGYVAGRGLMSFEKSLELQQQLTTKKD